MTNHTTHQPQAHQHTTATDHTPHTTHHRRQRTPARSGGDRPPPPAAKPSQEWPGVAHRNLRQEWRGTNHTTHQPQPHQHTTATHHTPHTTHHRRQRTPARSGGDRPSPPAAKPSQEWRGVAHKEKKKKKRASNPARKKGDGGTGTTRPRDRDTKKKRKKQKRKNTPRQPSQEGLGTAETRAPHTRPHRTPEPETAGGKRGAHATTHVP